MKRFFPIISVLAFSVFFAFGQSQQRGNYDNGLSGDLVGGYPEVSAASTDTTFIINETFSYPDTAVIPGWTGVGNVAIVDSVLEVTVAGGGSDYIKITTADKVEYTAEFDFRLASGYTGWDNDEMQGFFRKGLTNSDRF